MDGSPLQSALEQMKKRLNPSVPTSPNEISQAASQQAQAFQETGPAQNPQASISQALAQLKPDSKSKQVQVGKAIQSPEYAGYCLKWVDDTQGNTNRHPTAYADYVDRANQGQIQNSKDIPKGARVYFAPDSSNGDMGHVGIADGSGNFTSATYNGIKTFSLKDWEKNTGQQFIGWSK